MDTGRNGAKGAVAAGSATAAEKWFDGSKALAFNLDFESSSISTGALIKLGIYVPAEASTGQGRFAGITVGVLGEMMGCNAQGMEILVSDPVGSTAELNVVPRK